MKRTYLALGVFIGVLIVSVFVDAQPALRPGQGSAYLAGTGTTNRLTKWIGTGTIGNGSLIDTATQQNMSVCFDDNGVLNCGDANFTWNKATQTLTPNSGGPAGTITSGSTGVTGGADQSLCFDDGGFINCANPNIAFNKGVNLLNLTGTFRQSNGSAASPARSWISDSTTGWYRIGTGIEGWSSGGVLALTLARNNLSLTNVSAGLPMEMHVENTSSAAGSTAIYTAQAITRDAYNHYTVSNGSLTFAAGLKSTGVYQINRGSGSSLLGGTIEFQADTSDVTSFPQGKLVTGKTGTTTGYLELDGATSGAVTIKPQAAAGTWEFDLPITAGTAGQVLTSQGGAGTAMTWTTPTAGVVVGPGSATDNAVSRFDSTTGKLVQNSVVTIGDLGEIAGILNLASATSRIGLGGSTASFPALRFSTTTLEAVLADNSAFTPIKGSNLIATDTVTAPNIVANGSGLGILGIVPNAQTIAAGNTVTADGCGGIKRISSAGSVTTDTTNTFTAPAAQNTGCIMQVCNSGANAITLDANALFKTSGGADVVLSTADDCVPVGSDGAVWRQLGPPSVNS